ncbi:MAG: hypothetical protein WEB37_00240 [Bacteroidota bacterium]
MFIGHFAVALAAKKAAPRVSLGTMILSTSFIDLLWPLFLILGIENVRVDPGNTVVTPLDFYNYPYSHSLGGVVVWSILLGGVYFFLRKDRKAALVVGIGVLSHWILDLVTHRPDLPLLPGYETVVGFGLWNSLVGTLILEIGLFLGGVWLYMQSTKPIDRTGSWSFWALIIFLVLVYLGNLFGPPPPESDTLGYVGLAMWLFVAWGYWIDRHRAARTT